MILESRTNIKVRSAILRVDKIVTNELVVTDSKPTKFSRKRRAPMDELSGKEEIGRGHNVDVEFGADGKIDAVFGESCKGVLACWGWLI